MPSKRKPRYYEITDPDHPRGVSELCPQCAALPYYSPFKLRARYDNKYDLTCISCMRNLWRVGGTGLPKLRPYGRRTKGYASR